MLELLNEEKEWGNNLFAELTYYIFLLEVTYKMGDQELEKNTSEKLSFY